MKKGNVWIGILLVLVMLCTGFLFAQKKPAQNISARRHPNLAAAQRLVAQAYDKVTAAQKANEFDMSGHAAKAKDLLSQAGDELRAAATEANENK